VLKHLNDFCLLLRVLLFMNQHSLIERARQGDATAIATLLNHALQLRGIIASTNVQGNGLQVMLVAEEVPDARMAVACICNVLVDLNQSRICRVRVYGRKAGNEFPAWTEEFSLAGATPRTGGIVEPPGQPLSQRRTELLQSLRSFKFAAVVPYQDVFSGRLYRSGTVRLLLFFGLFPLAADLITDPRDLEQAAWILGLYYASIWGVVLYHLIKPPRFDWSDVGRCVLFTTLVGVPLLLIVQQVPPFSLLYGAINLGWLWRLVGFVLGVGVLEEVCKALPVYLFLLRPGKLSDPLTSAFYGTMSGLGFAIAEGATYSLGYAFGLVRGDLGFGSYVLVNTIRFVTVPLFHAILAGIVGYFVGLAAINPARREAILVIGVAIAAVLHGLYNTFAGGLLGVLVIAFSILLFVSYLRRSQSMVLEMQQAERLARQPLLPPNTESI